MTHAAQSARPRRGRCATSPSLHTSVVGTPTFARAARAAEREGAVPAERPRQRAVGDDLAAEAGDVVGRHARAPQAELVGPPCGRAASSGSHGSWWKSMYQLRSPCGEVTIARRNAAGCGTDTAVSVRTRSGRRRGQPPRDHGTPVVADDVHRTADRVDQRRDVARPACRPVVATPARPGAAASSRAGRARACAPPLRAAAAPLRASSSSAPGSRAAGPPAPRPAVPRRGRRRPGRRGGTT